MKDLSKNSSSTQFLKTDGGKTKSNSIEIPTITLPKGGGAIKGIDEKFSVNAVNGTSSFSIPLPFSPARGASPALSLSYNSGSGNGIFGLGWNLGLASIKRKTDKELPRYIDTIESDTFLLSDAEDLVPEFQKDLDGKFLTDAHGDYIIDQKDSSDGSHHIRFYKPRIEGSFARIERWTEKTTGKIKWRVTTKDNIKTLFGWSVNSVIADPHNPKNIVEWLPEFVFDDKGNCCHYIYKREDAKGFSSALLHHKNRLANGDITYTNLYLEKILYGNKAPYKKFEDPFLSETEYMFQTIFDYGEYDPLPPYSKIKDWNFRADSFSDFKSGFEIRTTRLCQRVLLFHFFSELPNGSALVKSIDFEYDTSDSDFTFLKSATQHGYIKNTDNTYTNKKLPATEFEYQKHDWNTEVKTISSKDLIHVPFGLNERQYHFTDLFNEGLAGILTEQSNGWYYKHNLGEGNFEQAKLITPKPSFGGLGHQLHLADLDADGGKQLVNFSVEPRGYFELNDENQWQPFHCFQNLPTLNLNDPNTKMIDLNGDGKPEILISEDDVFTWYRSEGRNGFSQSQKTIKAFDEEAGPHMIFGNQDQNIFLADMSGDGMTDIVRIRNGEVCYWPNLGYGRFGAKIAMDNAPLFDSTDSFNPSLLRLADIDGSGTTDIIYLGQNKFTCWMNLSGNRFHTVPFQIDAFPEIHHRAEITVTDLLGNGVPCIVWSSTLSKDAGAPFKYIDLMNSKKPHVMVFYKNNLGKEISLEYRPSTKFYIDDKLAGKPWITKLHFPVHCVSKTETRDKISGYRFVSSYSYHHGYYDHSEREFRGFGMVEQTDAEHFENWVTEAATNIVSDELHQEPVVSKTWVHTGAFLEKEKILNQFAGEYWYEEMTRHGFTVSHHEATLSDAKVICAPGIDPSLIDRLNTQEWHEALRACKGIPLRSETFAKDAAKYGNTPEARKKELTPFSVATHNCVIELLQPKGKNKHAVFIVKESEAINYNYERNAEDPRISHSLNIKLDEIGNILESAAVVYPRLRLDASLPLETQQEQNKTIIIFSQNQFTNDVIDDDVYRLRLASETKTFELKGIAKTDLLYSITDFINATTANEVPYHAIDSNPDPGVSQKRLVEHIRSHYYSDNLKDMLPLHKLESLAIPYESFQLAYTPDLITDIFGSRVDSALLVEGKFTHSEGDENWWIRSGKNQLIETSETVLDAQNRFYTPLSYTDPYGAKTTVKHYSNYFLFIEETQDALGNKTSVDLFNFRTLSPQRMRDINNNISESLVDELGLVKAVALFGKGNEADDLSGFSEYTTAAEQTLVDAFFTTTLSTDLLAQGKNLLQHATARYVYDFDAYKNSGKPAVVASIVREEHFQKNSESPVQLSFEYSNGLGEVVMKKIQAEPGLAKKVIINSDNTFVITNEDTSMLIPKQLRWIGNGRTILNNKGNAVKQYEPYFSTTHRYEDLRELVETGVTPIMYYDAAGRLTKTEMPDGTLSRVEFNSWKQMIFDANDTVLESSWYTNRTNRIIDPELIAAGKDPVKEKTAADKAAKHANTPTILHFDTLGRPALSIEHNKKLITEGDEFHRTKIYLDTEGNLRHVTDARELPENNNAGNLVTQYKYDMLGNLVYKKSMDVGQRWLLANILGNPLRTWDERNYESQYFYDVLHRPTHRKVIAGDGGVFLDNIVERTFYGESESNPELKNLRGKILKHYDTGGLLETPEYNFKGLPKFTTRKIFKNYKSTVNWIDANLVTDLENEAFTFTSETDALGRITKQTSPEGSILIPSYNSAGLLNGERVIHSNPANPIATDTIYIKDIEYNQKGERSKIIYGNDVTIKFYYDQETFRLNRLESKKQNAPLQDWYYTFDPTGNITHIEDKNIPVTFFNNQKITGGSEYTYDALYRLIESTGRENNAALNFDTKDNWNDAPFMHQLSAGDSMAVRNYLQRYQYDEVGNIKQMQHQSAGNNWTRNYDYEKFSNRLKTTQVGSETYSYSHHPKHGFIMVMPHLQEMEWNFKEELVKTSKQKIDPLNGTAETTYYQYDGQGQRIRKITENGANAGVSPTKKEERIYISTYETYRTYQANTVNFERESLTLMDEGHRFVIVETVRQNANPGPSPTEHIGGRLTRYQLYNHLGSSALELDDTAQIISYEEYHPYGTTAYQAMNSSIKAAAKRYRYTGRERDEETGLEYHSARYYLPWLGRWLNSDPIGIEAGVNFYEYSHNSPTNFIDANGKNPKNMEPTNLGTMHHYYTLAGIVLNLRSGGLDAEFEMSTLVGGSRSGKDVGSVDIVVNVDEVKNGVSTKIAHLYDLKPAAKTVSSFYKRMIKKYSEFYPTPSKPGTILEDHEDLLRPIFYAPPEEPGHIWFYTFRLPRNNGQIVPGIIEYTVKDLDAGRLTEREQKRLVEEAGYEWEPAKYEFLQPAYDIDQLTELKPISEVGKLVYPDSVPLIESAEAVRKTEAEASLNRTLARYTEQQINMEMQLIEQNQIITNIQILTGAFMFSQLGGVGEGESFETSGSAVRSATPFMIPVLAW